MIDRPTPWYAERHFRDRRLDIDAPTQVASIYGRPFVLAQRYRKDSGGPIETFPVSPTEWRRNVDVERGYIADPRDIQSVFGGLGKDGGGAEGAVKETLWAFAWVFGGALMGRAMAPTGSRSTDIALGALGGAAGYFGMGPLGLGIVGAVALTKRNISLWSL